jgi:hypothetical protein
MFDGSRGGVARGDPPEAHAFTVEVDARRRRVPLEESVAEPEREASEVVSPNQFGLGFTCQRMGDARDNESLQGVQASKMVEVRLSHRDDDGTALTRAGAGARGTSRGATDARRAN